MSCFFDNIKKFPFSTRSGGFFYAILFYGKEGFSILRLQFALYLFSPQPAAPAVPAIQAEANRRMAAMWPIIEFQ